MLTHGNGPQVGHGLLRQERAADQVPPLPLWLAVAQTQAEIGSLAVLALQEAGHRAACVLTHAIVAADDPAFTAPTKPIGPFYDSDTAGRFRSERGWNLVEERGRGWRRAVPSPLPLELKELAAIRALLAAGMIVVACGGGGIPVSRSSGGQLAGVDAVIDKDAASALLALSLDAGRLLILTDVDAVYREFGSAAAQPIRTLTAAEATALAQAAPPGSMGPKLASAAMFVQSTGREALITTASVLRAALAGYAGTRISSL